MSNRDVTISAEMLAQEADQATSTALAAIDASVEGIRERGVALVKRRGELMGPVPVAEAKKRFNRWVDDQAAIYERPGDRRDFTIHMIDALRPLVAWPDPGQPFDVRPTLDRPGQGLLHSNPAVCWWFGDMLKARFAARAEHIGGYVPGPNLPERQAELDAIATELATLEEAEERVIRTARRRGYKKPRRAEAQQKIDREFQRLREAVKSHEHQIEWVEREIATGRTVDDLRPRRERLATLKAELEALVAQRDDLAAVA